MFSALTRSSGCRRTATSRDSPVGSTQSPTSTPANATRSACAASPAEMPSVFARPRLSSIFSSSFGSCSDRPTSVAPSTCLSFSMKAVVISISLRESGPENWIWTGLRAPLFKSSRTTYSAPTMRSINLRTAIATSVAERLRSVLLPMSTYTRPPPALTRLLVATVSGSVRASSAAFSTFSRAYSRLALDGVRTSIARVPLSEAGKNSEPPNLTCNNNAPTKLSTAMMAIHLRWCKAHAITRP